MTSLIYIIALALLGQARSGLVELNCSDNATCIDHMAKEFVRSLRQQKTIRLFDLLTIEPLGNRQARSNQDPVTRMITTHAISFDWNDFTFRFSNPEDRSDALDLEVFESRSAKDVSTDVPKKSKGKDEEEVIEDKGVHIRPIKRRRHRRKVMHAVIPLLFGMKSAGVVIFALFVVSVITIKAFLASKMALMVTVGMALKKFYENYGGSVGLQNHPYLYSQYPIDFSSATSHAYSVSGVSPQFASPEMYSPTALATHSHTHELLQNDASAQQSQQAPTVLVNSTRATERWDGKSKLLRYLEPVVDKIRSFVDPIASVFYDAMPATFRGLNSDVSTAKNVEPEVEEKIKRPREILIPQPRHIAQRKMSYRKSSRQRPKKYVEFKIDLDKLKNSKDFLDYIKTKKYKHNYPNTYYYPRIKYYINPNTFTPKPNNNRLLPYRKPILRRNFVNRNVTVTTPSSDVVPLEPSDWKPIVVFNISNTGLLNNKTAKVRRKKIIKKRKRIKRSIDNNVSLKSIETPKNNYLETDDKINFATNGAATNRGFFEFFTNPFSDFIKQADGYAKKVIHSSLHSEKPPKYYTITYNLLMLCLDVIDGLVEVHEVIQNHLSDDVKEIKKTKKKIKKKKKPIAHYHHQHHHHHVPHKNDTSKVYDLNNN